MGSGGGGGGRRRSRTGGGERAPAGWPCGPGLTGGRLRRSRAPAHMQAPRPVVAPGRVLLEQESGTQNEAGLGLS